MLDNPREVKSNTEANAAMAIAALLLGLVFVWLTAGASQVDTNTSAARWLGVLLAGVGVGGLVFLEHVTLTLVPEQRRVILERRRLFGRAREELSFDAIAAVCVVELGQPSKGTRSYWLQLQPLRGRVIQTGRRSRDASEMHRLADRFAREIGCTCQRGRDDAGPSPTAAWQVLAAAGGALLAYAIWYRASVGLVRGDVVRQRAAADHADRVRLAARPPACTLACVSAPAQRTKR